MKKALILTLGIWLLAAAVCGQNTNPETAKIVTSDIDLFWKAYDKAKPENNLNVFRDEYLRKGSVGLRDFTKLRIGSSCALVGTIEAAPQYYAALREPSLKVAAYEPQLRASFRRLKELYPEAVFPDVYFMIGRMNSAGTVSPNGLLIGVDMFGKNAGAPLDGLTDWHKAVVAPTDRIPFIVAHELIHFEQKFPGAGNDGEWPLLGKALNEGGADFVGELIAGGNINPHLHEYGNPRERELWLDFKKEMDGKKIENWLYQGNDAKDRPADLGYYIGYKICESYYKNAKDKKQAVKDILEIRDFAKFLADSRYEEKFR
ncbi:MAG: hypothetical protein JSS81_24740 [Acidobacteria bacterium]|nr:hypothetical protein [Acidobacteriota bacterium]